MGRGGKRSGAGRPRGSKESRPRARKAIVPIPSNKNIEKYSDTAKPLYLQISKYLNQANRKLYKRLYRKYKSPLECLKVLRDDLMFRYNYARIAEMEGVDQAKQIAMEQIRSLKKKGKTDKAKILELEVNRYPRLSKNITELAAEIKSINETIDKIESGKPSKTMNIFNIMLDKNKSKTVENSLFTMPQEIIDAEVIKSRRNINKEKNNNEVK